MSQNAEYVTDLEAVIDGLHVQYEALQAENTKLRKLVDDAINGCDTEWLIDGLARIDGSEEAS